MADSDSTKPSKQKRRGRGEGGVSQRTRTLADGRKVKYWRASLRLDDGSRREVQAKTKAAVLAQLTEWHGKLAEGEPLESNATVSQLVHRWLEQTAKPSVRPGTYAGYKATVDQHIVPALGHLRLSQLKAEHIQTFVNKLTDEKKLAPSTVQRIRATLRMALKMAKGWKLIRDEPVQYTKGPRVPKVERARLTPDQAKAFLTACRDHPLGTLFTLGLTLGIREQQVLGLRWADVDLEGRKVKPTMALDRIDGRYELSEPKTAGSVHTIPLPAQLADLLRAERDRQTFERSKMQGKWMDKWGLVFTQETGAPIPPHVVLRELQKKVLPAAGLGHMRFHDLRGSCATILAVLGVHPRVAMEILGHTDIRTTMMFYTAVLSDSQIDAMLKMAEALWGEAEG